MRSLWIMLLSLAICASSIAQNTVGLLSYQQFLSQDGYNLIYPHNQPNVYLLDNCGEIVHTWTDDADFRPGNTAYITEEGFLYKAKRNAAVANDPIWAGGGGAILEIRDWDNNLIWDFEMNDSINRLHHDFAITEEGTIIALAWEYKNTEECIAAGRDTSTLTQKVMWPDWIFEIDPDTDEILWEWHAWDHLVQDFDADQSNFGIVANNPRKIDVNYGREDGHPDWMHGNSLDYNPQLGQILLSVPYFDEVWIIDHTTSTEEATGSTGGFANQGGDLLYRWGNPVTYDQGDSTDQKLFFQHDAHWVDDFVEPFAPYTNQIAVFNNRVGDDFSTVNIFNPNWDMYDSAYPFDGSTFGPDEFTISKTHPDPQQLYSTGLSSVQVLRNGNFLITSGRFGYSFEMTPDDEIVWEYKTPIIGGAPVPQYTELAINNNLTFRMDRYPIDYAAFDNKDLSPKGWIELEPDENYCGELTDVAEVMMEEAFRIFPNPARDMITITWDGMIEAQFMITDLSGKLIKKFDGAGGRKFIKTNELESGVYLISIMTEDANYTQKLIVE